MDRARRGKLAAVGIVVGIGLCAWLSWDFLSRVVASPETFRREVLAFGPLAPVVTVAISAAQVVIAPIPGQLVGVAAGFLYGVVLGSVVSMAGLAIGSLLAMWIGRRLGRSIVARLVPEKTLARLDAVPRDHAELAFFLIFLLPALPDDVACFAIGLSASLSLPRMLVIVVLGRLPGTIAAAFLGAHATDLPTASLVIVVAVVIVAALLLARYGDAIERVAIRALSRIRGDERDHDED